MNAVNAGTQPDLKQWRVRRQSEALGGDLLLPEETMAIRREVRAFADQQHRCV